MTMPRNARCVVPDLAYHITQSGTNGQPVFATTNDRRMYLALLRENLADAAVQILAYCLMTNRIHLVAVPARADSVAILLRRVHGRYAQAGNVQQHRHGHLSQNRFYSRPLAAGHLWVALRYVEQNPVRVRLAETPEQYPWSSARAHLGRGADPSGILDMTFWERSGGILT
jgi:putative transposase